MKKSELIELLEEANEYHEGYVISEIGKELHYEGWIERPKHLPWENEKVTVIEHQYYAELRKEQNAVEVARELIKRKYEGLGYKVKDISEEIKKHESGNGCYCKNNGCCQKYIRLLKRMKLEGTTGFFDNGEQIDNIWKDEDKVKSIYIEDETIKHYPNAFKIDLKECAEQAIYFAKLTESKRDLKKAIKLSEKLNMGIKNELNKLIKNK